MIIQIENPFNFEVPAPPSTVKWRVVSPARARKLRKRGVYVQADPDTGEYIWSPEFEKWFSEFGLPERIVDSSDY